jgi:hypothetical protein
MTTLQQRKQNLLNQRRQMIDQQDALKASLAELDRGIQRIEGALLLVQEIEAESSDLSKTSATITDA